MTIRTLLLGMAMAAVFSAGVAAQRFLGLGNVLAWFRPPAKAQTVPATYNGKLSIFILAGQSNMEGAAELGPDYISPDTRGRVFTFNKDYRWQIAKEPLSGSGVGPGVAFAARLAEKDPRPIGLIPCARGGTNIALWQPSKEDGSLYAECLKRARAASVMGEIAGVLFMQGENDTEGDTTDHPHDWARYFARMVDGFRADLSTPLLPVIFAQIGGNANNQPLWPIVQREQARVNLPGVSMIRTADLPYAEDVHFTSASYQKIGQRLANAYLATRPAPPS